KLVIFSYEKLMIQNYYLHSKTDEITPAYFETSFGTYINARLEERQYPTVCFHYIHNNPVVAKLVKHAGDWEFSSYRDYFANRDDSIINKERAKEFICIRLR
ncbi:MAG TPA: hypothetical protein PLG05_07720, partial [Bacteroidales bacterium]|nr:hypothetical protein [Bacteroidales bacterium]HPL05049.1 hypothetical protein [Bacteroidales bacterium]